MQNIIHLYYKKEFSEGKILVQLDPESFRGVELLVNPEGKIKKSKRIFDEMIYEDLEHDGFQPCSPLEFNLYLKGLVK